MIGLNYQYLPTFFKATTWLSLVVPTMVAFQIQFTCLHWGPFLIQHLTCLLIKILMYFTQYFSQFRVTASPKQLYYSSLSITDRIWSSISQGQLVPFITTIILYPASLPQGFIWTLVGKCPVDSSRSFSGISSVQCCWNFLSFSWGQIKTHQLSNILSQTPSFTFMEWVIFSLWI